MGAADVSVLERAGGDGGGDEKVEEDEGGVSIV